VTSRELGSSKPIAGVNMRLNAGGVRELHWHKAAEWSYMLHGTAHITAIDAQGATSSTTSAWARSGTQPRRLRIPSGL
jgi:oxalate decarboxylase/phosphoglucose isomerase-like protein (cupin superfamily)